MSYSWAFDQSRTLLAGIPRATLLLWQGQLQTAMLNHALGGQPLELSYMQGDGRKHVSYNVMNPAQANNLLMLVNRALGLPRQRYAMRPYFG